jgi:hypothetical protein
MKVEFGACPPPFKIERIGEHSAKVSFAENAVEIDGRWEADVYELVTTFTSDIEARIESGYTNWLRHAKDLDYEQTASDVRARRNALLSETDYIMRPDYPASEEYKRAVAEYSNALRDIPEQEGFPYHTDWPVKPERNL